MLGQILDGKYTIVRLLGQGGMGSVYEATELASGRRVAIKAVHAEKKLSDQLVRRFRREAKAAIAAASPHIAQVLDAGVEPTTGAPYMALEYLAGEDLEDLLQRLGPLPPTLALRVIGQACVGVMHAHGAGIVHRDIKPANLFLARDAGGELVVKVLDFGIAKIRTDPAYGIDTTGLTSTGTLLGSPLYMSPEQARGIKSIDHRTDVWSLGIVLYRTLTGRTPHHGSEALGDLILAICTTPPPLVQDLAPWVPPEVAFLCHAALKIEAEDRFPTVEAMLHAIRALTPEGLGLREDMLAPLTAAERSVVAHRLDGITARMPKPSAAGSVQAELPSRDTAGSREASETRSRSEDRANPAPGLVQTGAKSHQSSGALQSTLALGAALVAVLGGAAVAALAFRDAGTPAGAEQEAQHPAAQASAVLHENAAVPVDMPRASVRVSPQDALVEVNGVKASLKDGVIELAGALGTLHRVRVFKDGAELVEEVIITRQGAKPEALELPASAPKQRDIPDNTPTSSAAVHASVAPPRKRAAVPHSPPALTATTASTPLPKESAAPPISGIRESFE